MVSTYATATLFIVALLACRRQSSWTTQPRHLCTLDPDNTQNPTVLHRSVELTAAFFKNSLSCLSVLFSRRSLLNSWRSSVVSPSRSAESTSCCLIHLLKDSLAMPSSSAIFGIDLSEER